MIFSPFAYKQQQIASVVPPGPTDPDAAIYLSAVTSAGGTYTPTQQTAIDNLFISLKAANLYTKIKAMYPFVGGTSASHAINAVNTSAHNITFNGGWTHTSTGIVANGTNSYANTNVVIGTDIVFPDAHYSYRQIQTSPNNSGWDGYYESSTSKVFGLNLNTGGQISLGLYFLGGSLGTLPNYNSVMTGVRYASNKGYLYRNGLVFYTDANTRSEFTTPRNYFIGALNENGSPNYYNNNSYSFYTLGTKLDGATEIGDWSNIWNTFITSIGR